MGLVLREVLVMTKKPTAKARKAAEEKIASLVTAIEALYDQAQAIADESGVSFYAYDPKDRSLKYYPKRPADWVEFDDYYGDSDEDPNRDHPEHEDYHPWNNRGEYEHDWTEGHWISSSERC